MSTIEEDNDLIERFLLGKMDDREARAFKLRMEDDRELARRCRMLKMFPEMMSEGARKEMEAQKAETVIPQPEKKPSERKFRPVYIVFLIVIVAAAATFIYFRFRQTEPAQPQVTAPVVVPKPEPAPDTVKAVVPEKKDSVVKELQVPEVKPEVKPETASISPAEGETLSAANVITFRWKNAIDTFSRITVVSDATRKVILWRGLKPGLTSYEIPAGTFHPGIYYWYVGDNTNTHSFRVRDTVSKQ